MILIGACLSGTTKAQDPTLPNVQPTDRLQQTQRDSVRDRLNRELRRADKDKAETQRIEDRKESNLRDTARNQPEAESLKQPPRADGTVSPPVLEPNLGPNETTNPNALQLNDVIASTFRAFPLIEIARLEAGVARGEIQSAWGAYDTKIEYYSLNQPLGFYETYRNGLGVARQTWFGGYVGVGYRNGRGNIEPWYKERETNEAGEFKANYVQPLLQGRAIDPQRVELFQANLRQQAVGPEVQFQLLVATRDAALAYWLWVEQGKVLQAQERLLQIAVERGEQFELELRNNTGTRLKVSLNKQEIYSRQMKVNDTRMKFLDAGIKLSLFLRDESGKPMLASPDWLPSDFPEALEIAFQSLEQDLSSALTTRPEIQLIDLMSREIRWDLQLARNQTLPNVDFTVQAAQDVGQRISARNDKGELEIEAGIVGDVPIQRNKAFGKIQSTTAKLTQLEQKLEFQRNKIANEIQMSRNHVAYSYQNVVAARGLLEEATKVQGYFQLALTAGDFDLVLLLQQEVKVTEAEAKLYEAEREYFAAIAALQASLGLDPLDQSVLLSVP
ncbi:MAG: TolC family protein [Pirellula sp.]|nr:TolC family protein [Pirellula sp.]